MLSYAGMHNQDPHAVFIGAAILASTGILMILMALIFDNKPIKTRKETDHKKYEIKECK